MLKDIVRSLVENKKEIFYCYLALGITFATISMAYDSRKARIKQELKDLAGEHSRYERK